MFLILIFLTLTASCKNKFNQSFNSWCAARLTGEACRSFNDNCASGIQANTISIQNNPENSLMLVTDERITEWVDPKK